MGAASWGGGNYNNNNNNSFISMGGTVSTGSIQPAPALNTNPLSMESFFAKEEALGRERVMMSIDRQTQRSHLVLTGTSFNDATRNGPSSTSRVTSTGRYAVGGGGNGLGPSLYGGGGAAMGSNAALASSHVVPARIQTAYSEPPSLGPHPTSSQSYVSLLGVTSTALKAAETIHSQKVNTVLDSRIAERPMSNLPHHGFVASSASASATEMRRRLMSGTQ